MTTLRKVIGEGGTVNLVGEDWEDDGEVIAAGMMVKAAIGSIVTALRDENIPPAVALTALTNLAYMIARQLGPEAVANLLEMLPAYHKAMIEMHADA